MEYENSAESVKMDIVDNEIEIINDANKEKIEKENMENKPIMSIKQLNTLINDLNILCNKNPNFIFLQSIQFTILGFNNEITKWIEKTQLLIPAKSTRSKLSKDLKTTSKKDLLEVTSFHIHFYFYFYFYLSNYYAIRVFAKPRILKIRVLNSAFSNSFLGKITTFHPGKPNFTTCVGRSRFYSRFDEFWKSRVGCLRSDVF